jgi:hypothetical protein
MISLESEIVRTRYDPKTRMCFYTIERDGKRWTVKIPMVHFEGMGYTIGSQHRPSIPQRREHVATMLVNAMRGKPDIVE